MERIAVLVNPSAGRGRQAGAIDGVLAALGPGAERLTARTPEEARQACAAAVADGADALVAVGGDGTMNLALQAVAGTGVALGIVPAGTGNDVAACLGLPADPVAAARAIATGRTRAVDLARIEAAAGVRWSAGVTGLGFDTLVNDLANRMRFPRGPRRYDLAILLELARLRARPYRITIDGGTGDGTGEGETLEFEGVLAAVGNTARYGGGMRICPAADPHDGLLDLVYAVRVSRLTLMRIKPRVYAGTHVEHPAVHSRRGRTITVESPGITAYADGEPAFALPVTITAVPGALTLLG
nr:diacylglycerol kinase family protein [Hamadaea tsunoensis]